MQTAPVNFVPLNSLPLLKGSPDTNFTYKNFDQGLNNESWKFKNIEGKLFHNNLVLVDSYLPNILSHVVLHAFVNQQKSLLEVVDAIEVINPLNLEGFGEIKFYQLKIKGFLKHLALGLNAEEVYFGEPNIYEHYPVLKDEDDILYYAENIETFLNALLNKAELTILGEVYSLQGQSYLKLNLQITL